MPDTVYQTRLVILFTLALAGIFRLLKRFDQKKAALLATSILFLVLATHPICAAVYLTILCLTFIVSNCSIPDRAYYFIALIILLFLSPFLIHNLFQINTLFYSFASYYSLYRIIHYFIDVTKEPGLKKGFYDYVSYLLFFPCLCHGPIERINSLKYHDSSRGDVIYAIKKISMGLLKINIYFHFLQNLANVDTPALLAIYIKTINFYLIVTGDWDVVAGASRLLGFKVKENIPKSFFLQPTLTKMWRNGNATLIDWYFSYVYIPMAKNGQWLHLKLIAVFAMILGMHAFFNTLKFPSMHVVGYYVLMGVWFGSTLVLEKYVTDFFKKKSVKKTLSNYPRFIFNLIYGKNTVRYVASVMLNFNIIAVGLWFSPLYLLITLNWRTP